MERGGSPLLTDLYQLTMLQAYLDCGMTDVAVFEFFVRKLPSTWNFLVAAGLDDVLSYLEDLQFTEPELEWRAAQEFSSGTIDYLRQFRFSGDVDALPEGTIFFPWSPCCELLRLSHKPSWWKACSHQAADDQQHRRPKLLSVTVGQINILTNQVGGRLSDSTSNLLIAKKCNFGTH
jgi:hypothetical protein